MSATLPDKEALARVVAEITAVVALVEARVESILTWEGYAPLARRLDAIVQDALDAGCVELPGGPFGDGRTSLPIWTMKEGVVISPHEFTLWKGRMLKLQREAQGLLDAGRSPTGALAEALWEETRRLEESAGRRQDEPDSQTPALDHEDICILQYLKGQAPRLCTLYEIECGANISRKTAGVRLVRLIKLSLAERPRGPKRGVVITPAGSAVLGKCPAR